jgi:hypothetical protein
MPRKSTTGEAGTEMFEQIQDTIETVQKRLEVPAAAREFVQRSAATAKERAESVHTGASNVTASVEKAMTSLVGGYAGLTRGLIDVTYANVKHALETVEKVAQAQTLGEAVKIQADYVRENARANYDRVREAAEKARTSLADGAKTVQAELSGLYGRKAA